MQVRFKKLSETAITPTKAHASDAGFDLYASQGQALLGGMRAKVSTGIAIELPEGFVADVRPRSGITSQTNLRVQYGTVDASYRGEISIMVDNIGGMYEIESINAGMKLAQLVILPLPKVELVEADELAHGERGANGFGSTGV